jgi:glycosyltransferase involved in cell wall biosynthesis
MAPISVLIPCYNSAETIGALVTSIVTDPAFGDGDELIVVDDRSTDGSADRAAAAGARVVCLAENSGPSVARNRAVAEAANDIIVFFDSDTMVEPGSLAAVKAHFAKPGAAPCVNGICSPVPLRESPGCWYKALVEYSWVLAWLQKPVPLTCFNTRAGAMYKSIFERAGGFDGRYRRAEVEDYEFSYRLPPDARIVLDEHIMVRHDFPDIRKTMRVYFDRSAKWALLFASRRRFDGGGTSAGNGLGHLIGAAILPLLALTPLHWGGAAVAAVALAVFLWSYRLFFDLAARKKGTGFALLALGLHILYSHIIVAGAVAGLWQAWTKGPEPHPGS